MGDTRQHEPRPLGPTGSVQTREVLTLAELKRRLGWQEHAIRKARRAGARPISFGRQTFCLGSDLLRFFSKLGESQYERSLQRLARREGEGHELPLEIAARLERLERNVRALAAAQGNPPAALLTAGQTAELVGISVRTVWRLVSAGEFPSPRKIGTATRWKRSEVEDWIAAPE